MSVDNMSSGALKMDFMKLLITQMQNQNPLDPMSNEQMIGQLAQFSQLEQAEEMSGNMSEMSSNMKELNSSFRGAMLMAELEYAKSLLDKEVFFDNEVYNQIISGRVQKVTIQKGGPILEVHGKVAYPNGTVSEEMIFEVKLEQVGGIKS